MISSKKEFFENGVDQQKNPSIVFSIRRHDKKKIQLWSKEQKKEAMAFMKDCEVTLKRFKKYMLIP